MPQGQHHHSNSVLAHILLEIPFPVTAHLLLDFGISRKVIIALGSDGPGSSFAILLLSFIPLCLKEHTSENSKCRRLHSSDTLLDTSGKLGGIPVTKAHVGN